MANSLQSGCVADEAPSRARNQLTNLGRYNARILGMQLGTYAYRYRTHSATVCLNSPPSRILDVEK